MSDLWPTVGIVAGLIVVLGGIIFLIFKPAGNAEGSFKDFSFKGPVGVLVMIIGVAILYFSFEKYAPAPAGPLGDCPVPAEGQRTRVDAPSETGPNGSFMVHITCPPESGHEYVVLREFRNVDSPRNSHTVYIPKERIEHAQPGQDLVYPLDLSKSPVGSIRFIYVISVDSTQAAQLGQNTVVDNGILQLPAGSQIASNQAVCKRVY